LIQSFPSPSPFPNTRLPRNKKKRKGKTGQRGRGENADGKFEIRNPKFEIMAVRIAP
jgi:hypothetical protein